MIYIVYMMSAMIMIFLLLIIFFIAMKIKEKLRLRQHLIRRNARILQNNQNNQNNNNRRLLRQQDSLISYETAIQNKNSIIITQMIIDELNEFKLPTYEEALKTKNGLLNNVI